ncbi:Uncharacterized conserved protein, DUF433 family [Cryptosporangium aurantiacum]|uniref:Uncharacterized conserved protein, DUF433 family n=2 Tax=Cryptosporangium aurantiacum TaxID=134849 RepID=A0A1M7RD37_9ACTN|nr:Uncharacterized conserved protein, DUF433 family [Cryptosporangium aurantiacum]
MPVGGGTTTGRDVPLLTDLRSEVRHMVFDRITVDPAVMNGQPCIRGLRLPVATVVAMVADGMTTDEIRTELPDLTPDDVAEALRFAAAAVQERELPLSHSA